MHEIKRDTACFSDQQWYVDGLKSHIGTPMFSTEKDAQEALKLGSIMAANLRSDISKRVQDALDWL
jgi:hypothetical protein